MAHPKRRTSKERTRTRRAQAYKITTLPVTQECPNCAADKLMHRACPTCGHYRGRSVRAVKEFA